MWLCPSVFSCLRGSVLPLVQKSYNANFSVLFYHIVHAVMFTTSVSCFFFSFQNSTKWKAGLRGVGFVTFFENPSFRLLKIDFFRNIYFALLGRNLLLAILAEKLNKPEPQLQISWVINPVTHPSMSCKPRLLLQKSWFVYIITEYIWYKCEIDFNFGSIFYKNAFACHFNVNKNFPPSK